MPLDSPAAGLFATLEAVSPAAHDAGLHVLQGYRMAPTDAGHVAVLPGMMAPAPGDTVLDVGCSFGEVARLMRLQRPDLSFILLNRVAAQMRHAPTGPGFLPVLGDMHAIPLAAASVDGVIFSWALCHADHPAALAEAARVVKPGGFLFLYELTRTSGDNALFEQHCTPAPIPWRSCWPCARPPASGWSCSWRRCSMMRRCAPCWGSCPTCTAPSSPTSARLSGSWFGRPMPTYWRGWAPSPPPSLWKAQRHDRQPLRQAPTAIRRSPNRMGCQRSTRTRPPKHYEDGGTGQDGGDKFALPGGLPGAAPQTPPAPQPYGGMPDLERLLQQRRANDDQRRLLAQMLAGQQQRQGPAPYANSPRPMALPPPVAQASPWSIAAAAFNGLAEGYKQSKNQGGQQPTDEGANGWWGSSGGMKA